MAQNSQIQATRRLGKLPKTSGGRERERASSYTLTRIIFLRHSLAECYRSVFLCSGEVSSDVQTMTHSNPGDPHLSLNISKAKPSKEHSIIYGSLTQKTKALTIIFIFVNIILDFETY